MIRNSKKPNEKKKQSHKNAIIATEDHESNLVARLFGEPFLTLILKKKRYQIAKKTKRIIFA